ncbi:hypothetical protein PHYBOEH_007536 [Phytophthora boehmeriae]|uniref:Uncharacterized protein n=1 Tax=Phytophthora boehmeriae TaxID=109152 RepID=A0A8T1WAK6_9STRA|nr:hypothetical protein PHYBOEH_007536 [Phytophthora boehmeriae]
MEEETSIRYFSSGGYYVYSCPPDVDICLQIPGIDMASAERIRRSSLALLQTVNAINSDEDDEKEDHSVTDGEPKSSELSSPSTADEFNSDENDSVRNTSSSRLPVEVSNAALDLCPAIDTSMLESESEDEDEEESSESVAAIDSDTNDSEDGAVANKPNRTRYSPSRESWETDNLLVDRVDAIIRADMEELEAKKPWRFVFRCLDVPFEFKRKDDPFDIFFMRWDEFWHAHGRAVWERDFWQPLRPGSTEYHRRKTRQHRAMQAFRGLATDLVSRLGEDYRRWLAHALRDGWWYRTEPFTLRRLFLKDRQLYKEYLKCRARHRWPRGRKFLMERGLRPIWWAFSADMAATVTKT